jgi:hypothetical protein
VRYTKLLRKLSIFFKNSSRIWPLVLFNLLPFAIFLVYKEITNPAPVFKYAPESSEYLFEATNDVYKVNIGTKDGAEPEIRFENGNGEDITFTFLSQSEEAAKLEGKGTRSLVFRNIDEGIDIEYETLANGVKEWIVLNSKGQRDFFVFEVDGEGLEVKQNYRSLRAPGFLNEEGDYAFNIDRGFAIDALGRRTEEVTIQYIDKEDRDYLMVNVDPEWLNDSSRVFPVRIDPTIVYDESSEFSNGAFNRTFDSGSGSSPRLETEYRKLPTDPYTVALWHADEGVNDTCAAAKDLCDRSGNLNDGVFNGDAAFSSTAQVGEYSVTFDGNNDYVSIATSSTLNLNTFTYEAWVNIDSFAARRMIYDGGGQNNTPRFGTESSTGVLKLFNSNVETLCTSTNAPLLNTWVHVAVTYSASSGDCRIYLNGEVDVVATNTTTFTYGAVARLIGNEYLSLEDFDGEIDELRVSSIIRSAQEIKDSYERNPYSIYTSEIVDTISAVSAWNSFEWTELGVRTGDGETLQDATNLVAQWNLNETSGTTASNNAGSCSTTCNGTLSNFANTSGQDAANTGWTSNNRRWGAGALTPDGNNDIVTIGNVSALNFERTDSFTIEAWVRRSSFDGVDTIFTKMENVGGGFSINRGYQFDIRGDTDMLQLMVRNSDVGSNRIDVKSTTPILDSNWHHIVATYNGSSSASGVKLYIDGKNDPTTVTTDNLSATIQNAGVAGIAGNGSYGSSFDGTLDSIRIYSRVLTVEEVLSNYNSSNIEFQTRVGADTSPEDDWEEWRPATSETAVDSLDTGGATTCIGGNTVVGNVHTFTSSGTFYCNGNATVEYLVVAGGGGGGGVGANAYGAGGGGAGGYLTGTGYAVIAQPYPVTVGAGGSGGSAGANNGVKGGDSVFSGIRAEGGGYGARGNASPYAAVNGGDGGSGGGGSRVAGSGGIGSTGYNGGIGYDGAPWNGGGGGGSSSVGAAGSAGGAGGSGTSNSISGSPVTYAAGGSARTSAGAGTNASANTGNGGGGATTASASTYAGGNGGSGIVIIKVTAGTVSIADSGIKIEGSASQKHSFVSANLDGSTTALWHLDETNGDNGGVDAFDATTNNNDGEFNGSNVASAVVNGVVSKARDFNGTNDYISVNDSSSLDIGSGDFTIDVWIKADDGSASTDRVIISKGTVNSTGYRLGLENGGYIFFRALNQNVSNQSVTYADWVASPAQEVDDGKWHHIVAKEDGTYLRIFLDGQEVAYRNTGNPGDKSTSTALGIGRYEQGASLYFSGVIDELRISSAGRSAEEITDAYRMGRNRYSSMTFSSTDLSSKNSLPFYVAADRPGTYLEATAGESDYVNNQRDSNTIGMWGFEESADDICNTGLSDVCDLSGNGFNLTAISSPPVVQGVRGSARDVDGSADYLYSADTTGSSLDITGSVTIEGWVKLDVKVSGEGAILTKGTWDNWPYYLVVNQSGDTVRFRTNTGSGSSDLNTTETVPRGKWTYVVATYDGSTKKIYINGKLSASASYSGSLITNNGNLCIGSVSDSPCSTGTHVLDGQLDEIRLSNTARTAEQIRQSYEIGRRTHPITIDFAATLDSGNLIADSSDTSFTLDARPYGLNQKGSMLFADDKIIVRETVNDTEYIAQATVATVNESTGAVTITEWDGGGTFPSGGYTANATAFKWQREYWPITGNMSSDINAATRLTLRVTNGNEGRTVWMDDLRSAGDYLTDPDGSSVTSSTGNQYLQYRAILTSSDRDTSAQLSSVTLDYTANTAPDIPSLDSPADRSKQLLTPQLKTTSNDGELDDLQYMIMLCKNPTMTFECQTFNQTSSQTGWSGQDAQSSTMYASGTQATYTIQADLEPGTTYYWKSYAIDPDGLNEWSETQTTPYVFNINSLPRSASNSNYEHYIARRENSLNATSPGWSSITGAAESGTTASTNGWIDSANLTVGERYLVMVWGEHNSDSTSASSGLRLKHGSTAFTESQTIEKTNKTSTSHKTPYSWFTVWTAVSGEDLEVEMYWGGEAGAQARAEDITLVAINAEDLITDGDLKYNISTAGGTLSNSFVSKASVTWTPANNLDPWWIVSYSQADISSTSSVTYESRLNINSTPYTAQKIVGSAQFATDTPLYAINTVKTLPNSSNTLQTELRESSADQDWDAAGIMALRLNTFSNFFFDSQTGNGQPMDTAFEWIEQLNYDPTIQLQNNWLVAAGGLVQDDGSQVVTRIQNADINITDDVGGWNKADNDPLSTNLADVYTAWTAGLKDVDMDAQTTVSGVADLLDRWLVGFTFEEYRAADGPRPDVPANAATNQALKPALKMTAIDADLDTMKYKVQMCTDLAMTTGCQTFDQTLTQDGWSGQNASSFTRYQSGTQATYTLQSDLSTNTTYYWRAYAIDLSGLNEFSNPGEIFSFTTTNAPTAPTSLQTEGKTNPITVTDTTPELSAIHNDPDSDNANFQRIQVNTQSDFAGTMMWNPGKTSMTSTANGARSPEISYAGNALSTGVTYYWRIKFWDIKGAEGAWSATASFELNDIVPVNGCYMEETDDDTAIIVHWNNTNAIEDGYRVQRSVNGGAFSTLIDKAADSTSHTDSTISQGNTYRYRIAAKLGGAIGTYCTTTTANVQQGSIEFEGLQLGGIQIN